MKAHLIACSHGRPAQGMAGKAVRKGHQRKMKMGRDAKMSNNRIRQGGKDLSSHQGIALGQPCSGGHVGIDGKKNTLTPLMTHIDGPTNKIIIGHRPDPALTSHRNPGPRTQGPGLSPLGVIPAKVNAFMGQGPCLSASPPALARPEEHRLMGDKTDRPQTIGLRDCLYKMTRRPSGKHLRRHP